MEIIKDDKRFTEQVLSFALDLGRSMVKCGAEINRVEETVIRIGHAYGMKRTEVFSVVSVIHATVIDEKGRTHSQMRRITSYSTNFERLEKLNDLSRRICKNPPDLEDARQELLLICTDEKSFNPIICFGNTIAAAAFTVFFGGTVADALAAAVIAVVISLMQTYIRGKGASKLFFTALDSAVAGALALLFVHFGFGNNPNIIMIGDIMLLIPGLLLINSVREMLCGDLMSGLLRLLESVILAMAIACGFAIPWLIAGYIS